MSRTKPRAKKSLGQHFLADPNYCRKIARFADVTPQDIVLEIGPGTGQLTRILTMLARQVIAVEFDRDMVKYLQQHWPVAPEYPRDRLKLIQTDILSLDWHTIVGEQPVKIIGNLPYNISTQVLKKMTEEKHRFHSCTFMLQKEVAERILASPGNKDYGYFTILMEYHFERVEGFDVPSSVFVPRPKVLSHVLKLLPRSSPQVPDEGRFLELLQQAFQQRRKTLLNNLRRTYGADRVRTALGACHIERRVRPEAVTLREYLCLARML